MPITANALYRDSFNFLRNNLVSILLLALLSAFITVMLNQVFIPDSEQLKILSTAETDISSRTNPSIREIIQRMTPEEQMVLLKVSTVATFSSLAGNVLLTGGLLTLIGLVSQGRRISVLQAIGISLPILPRLLLLMLICILFTELGLILFVVPGVIIAVAVSLAPVVVTNEKIGVLASIKTSAKLAFANIRLIVPAMMLWLAAKLILLFLVKHLAIPIPLISSVIIISTLNNTISALLLVYLFRLYMLLRS